MTARRSNSLGRDADYMHDLIGDRFGAVVMPINLPMNYSNLITLLTLSTPSYTAT
jgi:hypothetical protein